MRKEGRYLSQRKRQASFVTRKLQAAAKKRTPQRSNVAAAGRLRANFSHAAK
jgi:hypothetical protein